MFGTNEPELHPLDPQLRDWVNSIMDGMNPAGLRLALEALPGPRNRLHAPKAMAEADELIMRALSDCGWTVEKRPFHFTNVRGCLDYDENGVLAGTRPFIYSQLEGANIWGVKEGLSSTDAIVIGAHYDTIRDSPGADDNTASVVALLELARILAPYSFERTIILAFFDMEEINLFGSRAFVRDMARERKIRGAMIFETMAYTTHAPDSQKLPPGIGLLYPGQKRKIERRRNTGDWNVIVYRKSALDLARYFAEALAHTAGTHAPILLRDLLDIRYLGNVLNLLIPALGNFARSDHRPFWKASIPAIMISDTANFRNPNYHRPSDTPDTLDYQRLAAIIAATAVALARSAGLKA